MTISVAMAAYNGEKFIKEQIESILVQLKDEDELVISINPSSDNTENIITRYQEIDGRIKLYKCFQKGVLCNFENAIRNCRNEIIFLADQDDIWDKNKVEKQIQYFCDPLVGGVCHGCKYIDEFGYLLANQPDLGSAREITWWEIIRKNPVQGSCLAFRNAAKDSFLPFPKNIPMHDSWIGLWLCSKSKLLYLNEPLLLYRQHTGTVTKRTHKKLLGMIKDRLSLVFLFIYKNFAKDVEQ